jgi:hypothetical protein
VGKAANSRAAGIDRHQQHHDGEGDVEGEEDIQHQGGMGSTTIPREANTSSGVPTPLLSSHLYSLKRPSPALNPIVHLNDKLPIAD